MYIILGKSKEQIKKNTRQRGRKKGQKNYREDAIKK